MEFKPDQKYQSSTENLTTMAAHIKHGWYVPSYQREYRWDEDNIETLLSELVDGCKNIIRDKKASAYLGCIILAGFGSNQPKNPTNPKISAGNLPKTYDLIIDGQQRITTLFILLAALDNKLRTLQTELEKNKASVPANLQANGLLSNIETRRDDLLEMLYTVSSSDSSRNKYEQPSVIREGKDVWNSENGTFDSPISKFLKLYHTHGLRAFNTFELDTNSLPGQSNQAVRDAFKNIKNFVEDDLFNDGRLDRSWIEEFKNQNSELFAGIIWRSDETIEINQGDLDNPDLNLPTLLATIAFVDFVMLRTLITVVRTEGDEADALSIFTALNTTGQSLTAFETMKPAIKLQIQKLPATPEETLGVDRSIKRIEAYLNGTQKTKSQRDRIIKLTPDFIIDFAKLWTGYKCGKAFKDQHTYLSDRISESKNVADLNHILEHQKQLAEYLDKFWPNLKPEFRKCEFNNDDQTLSEETKVLLAFLKDFKHRVTVPLLVQFYQKSRQEEDRKIFEGAVKAVSAFSILRRFVTGSTDGIDDDYNKLMIKDERGFCIKATNCHPLDIIKLQDEFKSLLKRKIGKLDREEWITQCSQVPIYTHSKVIAKVALMLAFENSVMDESDPLFLKRARENSRETFTLNHWKAKDKRDFQTIEHVSPQSFQPKGWEAEIYHTPSLCNTIGNLTLLPQDVNSVLGNAGEKGNFSWKEKYYAYGYISSKTDEEASTIKREALDDGVNLPDSLEKNYRIEGLEGIYSFGNQGKIWNRDNIERRSKNLLGLVWDKVSPWLDI
ncbi:MAG: hypothetical protein CMK56_08305 [Proteobacteria bacterium]|nr:hypothetical protein [Pseudomonadota bacterium]